MTLKLHIGTHKTATTLLQHFADRHRQRLRGHGLEYPDWGKWLGLRHHYAHHDLAHAMADNSPLLGHTELDRFWGMVREVAHDRDVLISAEPLYRYLARSGRGPRTARNSYVQGVGRWLRDLDVEVLVVYRRPNDFAASMYGEHVLQTRFPGTLDQFIDKKLHLFDYGWQIRLWQTHVGPVRHLCYEDLKAGDIVTGFFDELGVDVSGWERPRIANQSKDPALVELKRRANADADNSSGNNNPIARLRESRGHRRLEQLEAYEILDNAASTHPRSLWQSRDDEQAFLQRAIKRFATFPYWDEARYERWGDEPHAQTYRAEWLTHMKK